MRPTERRVGAGEVTLNVREWVGDARPVVLLHGLASNARTWDAVARDLAAAGHRVLAVDQRGHGRSDKPASGYDFERVARDLHTLVNALGLERPVVAGQSWGGNVVLHYGATYPDEPHALGFIDGGFIDLGGERDWESVARDLAPPELTGTPREQLRGWMRKAHPDWSDEGIEATLENMEALPDGTVRARLAREHHMAILRALWEQRPAELFPRVSAPVLIAVADRGVGGGATEALERAVEALPRVAVERFEATDHDIHVHRPSRLARVMLDALRDGIWSG